MKKIARGMAVLCVIALPILVFASEDSLQQQLSRIQQSLNQNAPTANQLTTAAAPATNTATTNTSAPNAQLVQPDQSMQNPAAFSAANPNPYAGSDVAGSDVNNEAFGRMTQSLLPLSPEQIKLLHLLYSENQRAASQYPGIPPKPISTSLIANLSPGATPPIIRLGSGFVTALVFLDSTGAPWPIASYSLGNPQAYNIQWDQKNNILLLQAITAYRRGNIAVLLKGLNTPVMLEFMPGQQAMDVRADIRVPGLGPEATPSISNLPGVESPYLLNLLDGIPPQGSKELTSSGCSNCVWLYGRRMYLRTRMTVLSPAWISTMSSIDGTHVYEMQPTPVVLASRDGKVISMTIQGF